MVNLEKGLGHILHTKTRFHIFVYFASMGISFERTVMFCFREFCFLFAGPIRLWIC